MDATSIWPPSKYALERLMEENRISYGAFISFEDIEKLFNVGDRTSTKFIFQMIEFRSLLKWEGFAVTERDTKDGIRILDREEMADHVRRKESSKANNSIRNSLMLSKVPREGMKEEDVKSLDHWENKSAVLGAVTKNLIRKRNLPNPETAVKSVRQIQ